MEPPELWWSKIAAEWRGSASGGVLQRGYDGGPEAALPPYEGEALDGWPADVVLLVPAKRVDENGHGDSVATRRTGSVDRPPFAPELADAPIVTGESGAPAPMVVDEPVHESTLPAELDET